MSEPFTADLVSEVSVAVTHPAGTVLDDAGDPVLDEDGNPIFEECPR